MSKIKEARIASGLTQQQFSNLLEIPKRTIQDWEGGKRTPPPYVEKLILFYLEHRGSSCI